MKRVLLVEDDSFIRDLVSAKLEQSGFKLETAGTGEEALSMLENDPPDALLLDLRLPKMQGDEVLEEMKAKDYIAHTPVIVFSNISDPEIKSHVYALGASAFFTKIDTDLNVLVTKVNELVS